VRAPSLVRGPLAFSAADALPAGFLTARCYGASCGSKAYQAGGFAG